MTDIRLPQRINGEFADVPALTAPDIGKALTVASTSAYTYAAFATSADVAAAVAAHVGLADPHTQYLLESAHTIASAVDFTDATGAGPDGYSVTWDNDTSKFVLASVSGGGGTPGGSDTQVQFNDGGAFGGDAGLVYNKTDNILTNTGRFVFPKWSPAADSTTALQITKADGSTAVVTVDTTNDRFYVPTASAATRTWLQTDGVYISTNSGSSINSYRMVGLESRFDSRATSRFFHNAVQWLAADATAIIFTSATTSFSDGTGNVSVIGALLRGGNHLALQALDNRFTLTLKQFGSAGGTADILRVQTQAGGAAIYVDVDGKVAIGQTSATALLDLAASSTARASLRIRNGTWPTTPNDGNIANDGNAIAFMVNGTNAVNTDGGLSVWMQSASQARNVGRLLWQYTDKTDATRKTQGSVTAFDAGTEYKAIRWGANGEAILSFYDVATPIARQVLATGAGATVDDVISALQALGLVKQS
jgi:hypothetical protein